MVAEDRIQAAIAEYKSFSDDSPERPSIRAIGRRFEVSERTIRLRLKGREAHRVTHQANQRFSVAEEDFLKRWIISGTEWGLTLRIEDLRKLAECLLLHQGDRRPLGETWHRVFLKRHTDMKGMLFRYLDPTRTKAESREKIKHWFDIYNSTVEKYCIAAKNPSLKKDEDFMQGLKEHFQQIGKTKVRGNEINTTAQARGQEYEAVELVQQHG